MHINARIMAHWINQAKQSYLTHDLECHGTRRLSVIVSWPTGRYLGCILAGRNLVQIVTTFAEQGTSQRKASTFHSTKRIWYYYNRYLFIISSKLVFKPTERTYYYDRNLEMHKHIVLVFFLRRKATLTCTLDDLDIRRLYSLSRWTFKISSS